LRFPSRFAGRFRFLLFRLVSFIRSRTYDFSLLSFLELASSISAGSESGGVAFSQDSSLPNVTAEPRPRGKTGGKRTYLSRRKRTARGRCALAAGSPPFFLLKTSWSGNQDFLVRFLERFAWSSRIITLATSFFSEFIFFRFTGGFRSQLTFFSEVKPASSHSIHSWRTSELSHGASECAAGGGVIAVALWRLVRRCGRWENGSQARPGKRMSTGILIALE
jgi:hypothetical protein